MQWTLVAVGKLRPALREVCDDYLKRFSRFAPMVEREVREAGNAGSEALQRTTEARRIVEAIPARAQICLLDVDGAAWSSEQLAERVDGWRLEGRDRVFVIGGAAGIPAEVRATAQITWSLGPLTLPHELARVLVMEQLYRASTILRGEPYHRGGR